jgi:hypothetical protein
MNTQATIETLNDLVEVNNDRIEGYQNALKQIDEKEIDTGVAKPDLRMRF